MHIRQSIKSLITFTLAILALNCEGSGQGIYTNPLNDISGSNISLQRYTGKKMLFIILSTVAPDSVAYQIKKFKQKYGSLVQMIGILSAEDGATEAGKPYLQNSFSGIDILLTSIVTTRKGESQSPLLQWLTNHKQNLHFDRDVKGPGQKFFVSENGTLYAVIGPEKRLDAPVIEKIVRATVK